MLIRVVKYLLLAVAFTPLIYVKGIEFSFALSKVVFFRSLIEIALILSLVYVLLNYKKLLPSYHLITRLFKNPLVLALLIFLISLVVSTIFAVNPYRAFWGEIERGEGLFGFLHYFAFLGMALLVFERKDWLNFFKLSLFAGLIIIFYGVLQYFGIEQFPFSRPPSSRPDSLVGNSAFLSTYMFFILMFASIVWYESREKLWRYGALVMVPFTILTIFLTQTRGALVGLAAGVVALLLYFSFKKPLINADGEYPRRSAKIGINQRAIAAILLVGLVSFGVLVVMTRDTSIWQKVPGLSRLVQTATFDVNDASVQTRLIAWQSSLPAFKERPIFGWGPENYLIAYSKYYNPDYAIYGETWLDRAHNKVIDTAVMQGIFGLISYLSIFGAAFYLLFKKPRIDTDEERIYADKSRKGSASISQNRHLSAFIAAAMIAYFVQNLVLFDQVTSYVPFFALLGYVISQTLINADKNPRFYKFLTPVIVIVIVIVGYSLYAYNYVPYAQAKAFNEVKRGGYIDTVQSKLNTAMYPYNFAQYNIRGKITDFFYEGQVQVFEDPSFASLSDLLVQGVEEILAREPYDPRMFIRKAEMFEIKARVNPEFYKVAEEVTREALKLSPNRQELHYHLAFSLAGQERLEESIEAARFAIALSPGVARAHYHFALMLVLSNANRAEAEKELALAEELAGDYSGFLSGDINGMALIYRSWGRVDKVANLVIKFLDGEIKPGLNRREFFEDTLRYYAVEEDGENFIKVASYLSRYSDLRDDMGVLIDLAEKGRWDIIRNL